VLLRNTHHDWGEVAKAFHWTIALLILGQFALGWTARLWHLSPTKIDLFVWHKSFGMLILTLMLGRVAWRAINPPPALPLAMPVLERRAVRWTHWSLYLLAVAMPLSGWVINSATDFPVKLFWLVPLPDIVEPDKALAARSKLVHLSLFWTLAALVAVHVAAALRHHFWKRDSILLRMLPGKSAPPESLSGDRDA
jgi:cytochrome b561